MPREREKFSKRIKSVDYDIGGNRVRAYYNSARELIFVLDETINRDKPNVLLVIDSFDERKWDDVLSNDYGIDLETIRPKKDNKYQKLDIEYGGLDVYAELIDAYESDDDMDEPLENLKRFQIMAVRRSAKERLSDAEETATKARETIERTNDAISELRARIKELRAKLSEQKRNIGREPTKTSAAKILKTEAQIDATNEKLARAKKRLSNAQRRLIVAEDDAEMARAVLARTMDVKSVRKTKPVRVSKPAPVVKQDVWVDELPEPDVADDEYNEEFAEAEPSEALVDEVDTEEVKPLFDSDPNILDDNIAFKPINFDAVSDPAPVREHVNPDVAPAPLSFTPPSDSSSDQYKQEIEQHVEDSAPMLDSLTSIDQPTADSLDIQISVDESAHSDTDTMSTNPEPNTDVQPAPVPEIVPAAPVVAIEPVRPVSPVAENIIVETDTRHTKKPTLVYYLMLILLIGLSIFTLWLYQQKHAAVLPDLAATTNVSKTTSESTAGATNIPSPFVDAGVKAEPVAAPVVDNTEVAIADNDTTSAVVVAEPEPVAVSVSVPEPIVEPEPVAIVDAEPVVESPFVELRTIADYEPEKQSIPSEEEILARKPGYSVSQQDKMFVASPDYNTDAMPAPAVNENVAYSMDLDVQPMPATDMVPEIVASEVTETSDDISCSDGAPADENGCCRGEEYMYTADGYMCCVNGDCFPPLF